MEKDNQVSSEYLNNLNKIYRTSSGLYREFVEQMLPKRNKCWNALIEKYSDKISDNDKLNSKNSNSKRNKKYLKNNASIEKINDEKQEDEYPSKDQRSPVRKNPATVQYWVNTGNSPHRIVNEVSESGSFLSEKDKSEPTFISQQGNSSKKQRDDMSLYSSVDTAAYILSNANVTKKSNATAIVEEMKNFKVSTYSVTASMGNILKNNFDNDNDKSKLTTKTSMKISICNTLPTAETPIKNDSNNSPINHSSMKTTDIPPTLAHFNEIPNSKDTHDEVKDNQDLVLSDENDLFEGIPKISNQSKSPSRKKLYTDRSSPIDIVTSALINAKRMSSRVSIHPALAIPTAQKHTFTRRRSSWFQRRRKKRFLQLTDISESSVSAMTEKNTNVSTVDNSKDVAVTENSELCEPEKKVEELKNELSLTTEKSRKSEILTDSNALTKSDESTKSKNGELERKKKFEDLVGLCSRKKLVIRLEKYRGPKSLSVVNEELEKSQPEFNYKCLTDISCTDLESQGSEQSTIVICKCRTTERNDIKIPNNSIEETEELECNVIMTSIDESSSTKLTSQLSYHPVINLTSDDEDNFVKIIRSNMEKNKNESNNDSLISDKTPNITLNDQISLIRDLTEDPPEKSETSPRIGQLVIVDSDDEIPPPKLKTKRKKRISRSQLQMPDKSAKVVEVKTSLYQSTSDTSTSDEDCRTSLKRPKLIRSTESSLNNNSKKFRISSEKCTNRKSNNLTPERKREAEVQLCDIITEDKKNEAVPKSPIIQKKSSNSMNASKNSDRKKRSRRSNKNLPFNRVILNDSSSDDNDLVLHVENNKKLLVHTMKNEKPSQKNKHTNILSYLFDDTSSDESIKFTSFSAPIQQRTSISNEGNTMSRTFQTRLDDSDSDN